ncbi:putative NAD dependent epimerase/dehydratase [Cucurbitaria berberidis CBS 394.84]|uniref:NAD dependent epimerase/dehydratase n=1 Tax=Cucurbitaria berberidis CBS 394.84 TaxID=1168544 RepID=A0A9P4GNN1_9PLEO|nr:putative NAD dependent epimerase/dehydratase [Cucurbitaria berberidis CBS 394.84]KAF1849813.1 putative NAD dependent epimerase/dehydratase [Cucurbitaria berberidis CBS 394.84]
MPQTIFITGASGYIGTVLTSHCIASGYTVRALSRSSDSDTKLLSLGAIPTRGGLASHDVLTREASSVDMVIALADALAGNYGNMTMEERSEINNAAIAALAAGMEGSGKPLVVTSGTLQVADDPQGNETDETAPSWPEPIFGVGVEATALKLKEKGIRVSVVRLAPWVYGRGGSGVRLFMQGAVVTGELIYVDDGSARTTTVHVDDAARLFLLVAQNGGVGEIYNATSETHVTFKQLMEAIGRTICVPVRSQSYADTEATRGRFIASFLSLQNRASNKKAREELGWTVESKVGILDEIAVGSYVSVVKELRESKASKVELDVVD